MLTRTLPGPFQTHGKTCADGHGMCLDRACGLRTLIFLRAEGMEMPGLTPDTEEEEVEPQGETHIHVLATWLKRSAP